MKKTQLTAALLASLAALYFTQTSQAQHVRWSIGIGLGYPGYYRPYYGYGWGPYPYYAPPPYVYAPPPVVVPSAPVVIQQPAPVVAAPTTIVAPAAQVSPPPPPPPAPVPVIPAANATPVSANVNSLLAHLNDAKDTTRRDAAMDLGRAKAQAAIDPLMNLLAKDSSPLVRDAAARALGLIGSSRSLNALIYAAQADNDRDVRHSAQFAVEVIRTNLRGN